MSNKIKDMHWKICKNLTDNYGTVFMGNMSTKRVLSTESQSELKKVDKRVLAYLSLFRFRERLKYKCQQKGVKYVLIDESYTTKVCSECCHYSDKMNIREKICICGQKKDRDINSGKNITKKGLLKVSI